MSAKSIKQPVVHDKNIWIVHSTFVPTLSAVYISIVRDWMLLP